jgi:hypothetical protein
MAEISDAELAAFNEALKNVTTKFSGLDLATEALKLKLTETNKTTKDTNESYKRLMRERQREEQQILSEQRKGRLTARETQLQLQALNDRVKEVVPPEFKAKFDLYIRNQGYANNVVMSLNSQLVKFNGAIQGGTTILSSLYTNSLSLVKAYQGGETDIRMAGTTTAAAASVLFKTTSVAGNALSTFGDAAMAAAPVVAALGAGIGGIITAGVGIAAKGLGIFLNSASEAADKLAQTAIPILTSELDKLYTNFNLINSAGLVFAGGIRDMANAGLALNLTLPEFAEVVKANTQNLSLLGISSTEAAKRMGDVGTTMRKSGVSLELQKLGFTFREQAGLIADTMGLMRQSGGSLTSSNEEVAQQTSKYAENLRIISAITGEDAKRREQEVRDQTNEVAFQQKLAGMDEKTRLGTIAAMENMSVAQRKAFMETVVFGQAITPASAYMMSNMAGFGESINRAMQNFQDGTLDGASMRRINADLGSAMKADIIASTDLARAGMAGVTGLVQDLREAYKGELQERNRVTQESITAAEQAVEKQKATSAQLDTQLILAANAGRDMAKQIQETMLDSKVLENTAWAFKNVTEAIVGLIRKFTESGITGAGGFVGNISEDENRAEIRRMGERLAQSDRNMLARTQAIQSDTRSRIDMPDWFMNSGNNTQPNQQPASMTSVSDAAVNDIRRSYGLPPLDNGGIASGPKSGYLAMLHGTEAVLPENLTELLTDAAKSAQTVKEQIPTAMNTRNMSDELLTALNSKFDDMISLLDDISSHTERTSVRVA